MVVIGPQIKEKQGGHNVYFTKYPSLNRVNPIWTGGGAKWPLRILLNISKTVQPIFMKLCDF